MAMSDTQRGAAIAMAFAHSQGRDPEGGLPPQDKNSMTIEGPNIQDNTGGMPNVPPKMGPQMPTDDPYLKYRTQQA